MSAVHAVLHPNAAFLATFLAFSIGVLAVALLVEQCARSVPAAVRHLIVISALVMPALFAVAALMAPAPPPAPAATTSIVLAPAAMTAAAETRPSELPCILAGLWLAGAGIALARAIAEALRWRAIGRDAQPITDADVRARVAPVALVCPVGFSERSAEPMVAGFFSPRILLPGAEYVRALSAEELETVFAHELEHVVRRDNLLALVARLASALFWFDPLHALAQRRLVELRERACDEAVLDRGCEAEPYLAALAKSCQPSLRAPAVSCMSRIHFRERMESIMSYDPQHVSRPSAWIVRIAVAAAVVMAAAGFAVSAPQFVIAEEVKPATDTYDFDVKARRRPGGNGYVLNVTIHSPQGFFNGIAEAPVVPTTRTITHNIDGRSYSVVVQVNADGSATGTLEVKEGEQVLAHSFKAFAPVGALSDRPTPDGYKRVGGEVKAPVLLHRVEPVYPDEARKARISGIVIVEVQIDETGAVRDAQVLKPLPFGLDQSAVDAVRQWRFRPGTHDGKPVPVMFNLTINFKLNDVETE